MSTLIIFIRFFGCAAGVQGLSRFCGSGARVWDSPFNEMSVFGGGIYVWVTDSYSSGGFCVSTEVGMGGIAERVCVG